MSFFSITSSRGFLLFIIALMMSGAAALGSEEYRTLTNQDGHKIEARIVDYNPHTKVTIELPSGERYKDVRVDMFSREDQEYFKQWEAERLAAKNDADLSPDTEISVFVKSARDNDLNNKGDPDNREVEYEPAITIDSKEKDLSYKNVAGTLVFIGQSVLEKREYHILYRENFTVNIPARGRVQWEGTPFTNIYDDFPSNGSAFGSEYEGYLIVLRNKNGDASYIKASKSSWRDDYQKILSADKRRGHSRDFSESFPKTVYPPR